MMSFCTAFLNPSFSTVTAYVPTNKFGKTYVPALEVVVAAETPVASFSTVTFASSILAWLLSVIVTRSVPSSLCARAALPSRIQIIAASAMTISLRIAMSPSNIFVQRRTSSPFGLGRLMLRSQLLHKLVDIEGHPDIQPGQFVP